MESWSHVFLAHAGDSNDARNTKKGDFSKLAPSLDNLKSAHKSIVQAATAVSVHVLDYPKYLDVVPSYTGSSPFNDLIEITGDNDAPGDARRHWLKLRDERNEWMSSVEGELAKVGA